MLFLLHGMFWQEAKQVSGTNAKKMRETAKQLFKILKIEIYFELKHLSNAGFSRAT